MPSIGHIVFRHNLNIGTDIAGSITSEIRLYEPPSARYTLVMQTKWGIFEMKGRFQSSVSIKINASANKVWEIIDDISLIPQYHPEVGKVDLLSGQSKRTAGVKYQCSILEGRKGTCVEEVVDYIPNKKLSTTMTQDSWGLDKMLADFIVDTSVNSIDDSSCYLKFDAYYNPIGLWNKILNLLILKRTFRNRSKSVMEGIKLLAEAR